MHLRSRGGLAPGRHRRRCLGGLADIRETGIDLGGLGKLVCLALQIGHVGFAHGIHELSLKFAGHPAHFAGELPDLPENAGKILGRNEDKRHNADDQQLAGVEIEHGQP